MEKIGKYHYKLVRGVKAREFKLYDFYGNSAYWHFEDNPYDPKDPSQKRDGDKISQYRDLRDGMEKLREQYEFSVEEGKAKISD